MRHDTLQAAAVRAGTVRAGTVRAGTGPSAGHDHRPAGGRRPGWVHFLRHYLEMVVAMLVGMIALGPVVGWLLSAAGLAYSHAQRPDLAALEMTVTMSAGMVAWMRFRGHGWPGTLEMTAAMFVPAVVLIPLLWLGAIPAGSVLMVMHVAMLPLMLAAMLRRRDEYAVAHGKAHR
jgi:hypothetical protein